MGHKTSKPASKSDAIENGGKTGRLVLTSRHLTSIPPKIWSFGETLRLLDLSNNAIRELPPQVGNLVKLQSLKLSFNKLAKLPVDLAHLKDLKTLNVDNNQLQHVGVLPTSSLRHLDLSHNRFSGQVGHPNLAIPCCVYVCNLSHNQITSFAPSFGFCVLKEMQELDFDNNMIETITSDIGCLEKLTILKMRNNNIATLPTELFTNTPVNRLELEGNPITLDILRSIEGFDKYLERRKDRIIKGMSQGLKQDQLICGLEG